MTFWLDFCNFPRHAFAIQPPCNYASTKKLPEGIGHHIPKTCSHLLAHCGPDSGQVLKYLFIIYHIHVWANQDDLGIHHQGLRGDQKTKNQKCNAKTCPSAKLWSRWYIWRSFICHTKTLLWCWSGDTRSLLHKRSSPWVIVAPLGAFVRSRK